MNTLTLVHRELERFVQPGNFVIDATAGNGHDTLFLAGLVGAGGRVVAFDVQQQAIDNTRERLRRADCAAAVQLVLDSHANMARYAQPESVDCIVFNLGWLPGSDHSVSTRPESTLAAIDAGLTLLRPDGLMCVSIYYGGASGFAERDAVLEYVRQLDSRTYTVLVAEFVNRGGCPPIPVFITKSP